MDFSRWSTLRIKCAGSGIRRECRYNHALIINFENGIDSENIPMSIIKSESYYFVHYQSPLLYIVAGTFKNIHQYLIGDCLKFLSIK